VRSVLSLLNLAIVALSILVPLAGIVLIATRVAGKAKRLGIAGCAVLAGTALVQSIWIYAAPRLVRSVGTSLPMMFGVANAVFAVLSAAGLALVIAAVLSGRRDGRALPPERPNTYPGQQSSAPQGPYAQGQPYPQQPQGPYSQPPQGQYPPQQPPYPPQQPGSGSSSQPR
jgi:hypothetical protein